MNIYVCSPVLIPKVEAFGNILAVGSKIGRASIDVLRCVTIWPAPVNISATVGFAPALGNSGSVKSATTVLLTSLNVEITNLNAALYSAAVGALPAAAKELDGIPTGLKIASVLTDDPSYVSKFHIRNSPIIWFSKQVFECSTLAWIIK